MNSVPAIRALFCDVGGVLIENPWIIAARELTKEFGVDGTRTYRELAMLGRSLDLNQFGMLGLWRRVSDSLAIRIPYTRFRKLVLDDSLVRMPLVWDAVRSLRRSVGLPVFALSNMCQPVWRSLQRKYGIESLFDGETLSYRCGIVKPDPRIFTLALKSAHRTSIESLFLDDLEPNIAAASSLGFRVYLVRSPSDAAKFVEALSANAAGQDPREAERG
jgi:FMN phosphatase YigB (HAD superfamily)